MMNTKIPCALGLLLLISAAGQARPRRVRADIAQPDGIVYGVLRINGEPVRAIEDVTILARVDGFANPVSIYRMGRNPSVGDRYVLHIPHAVQADGQTTSTSTPESGALAKIYVRPGNEPEVHATDVAVPASGQAKQVDLSVSSADWVGRSLAGELSSTGCGSGGGTCGAMGMVSLAMTFCGLVQMKHRPKRRNVKTSRTTSSS
jgi:hypothetical protein